MGPETMLFEALIPALEEVGARFERGDFFVPEMLIAGRAMSGALNVLRPLLADTGAETVGTFLMGTVKGDVHDIGKNLVDIMLEGAGFKVIDLGVQVAPEKFVEAIQEHKPDVVGFSAFLTTTMPMFKVNIEAHREGRPARRRHHHGRRRAGDAGVRGRGRRRRLRGRRRHARSSAPRSCSSSSARCARLSSTRHGSSRLTRARRQEAGLRLPMCGQCVLHDTGMTCPMTCPKTLRNGPCGGVREDGHCEVKPEMRCVWVKADERAPRRCRSCRRPGASTSHALRPPVDNRLARHVVVAQPGQRARPRSGPRGWDAMRTPVSAAASSSRPGDRLILTGEAPTVDGGGARGAATSAIAEIAPWVDAINATDNTAAHAHASNVAVAIALAARRRRAGHAGRLPRQEPPRAARPTSSARRCTASRTSAA